MGRRKPISRIFPDTSALNRGAAEELATRCAEAVRERGRCTLVLSGGSTPAGLYRLLAREYGERIPWGRIDVYWGDERYVPHADPKSNYRLAREQLLDLLPVKPAHIHPIPTGFPDPEESARAYERLLKEAFPAGQPAFDFVLLGLGRDGHVASLFPSSPGLLEQERWVLVSSAPAPPITRISLTFPALNAASEILLLVSGLEKAGIMHTLTHDAGEVGSPLPVSMLAPDGPLLLFADRQAAGTEEPC